MADGLIRLPTDRVSKAAEYDKRAGRRSASASDRPRNATVTIADHDYVTITGLARQDAPLSDAGRLVRAEQLEAVAVVHGELRRLLLA
jgi:hypothetical protein